MGIFKQTDKKNTNHEDEVADKSNENWDIWQEWKQTNK